ncbi:hypothetical protein [Deinococcus sp. Leaf326]|uniref:hypothetical protein n=1 Tax=Deinococcus sp. Leaf326 TaxID=1736338 RepID=UPI0006FC667B|nr:hypothetical protein [Deinococcus sp. Leaf326]KQR01083.1 hypothetical protein ASF71_13095 [Deinococcus sp. Leaf326]
MKLSNLFYVLGFASVALSASQYLGSGKADHERDGLFVGHWAPTFLILGKIAEDRERRGEHPLKAN